MHTQYNTHITGICALTLKLHGRIVAPSVSIPANSRPQAPVSPFGLLILLLGVVNIYILPQSSGSQTFADCGTLSNANLCCGTPVLDPCDSHVILVPVLTPHNHNRVNPNSPRNLMTIIAILPVADQCCFSLAITATKKPQCYITIRLAKVFIQI